ncbi:MAG: hypothetical protein IKU69_03895 [Roseburia sp.]|nr:hypothetical protein [Roseburia sp.]
MSNFNNLEPVCVNTQYKDRLFKLVFKDKKDLLELYNAINDTDYNNPDDIEINTMEDVVYMGMKNDVSFLICDILNLYEHQSTFSLNLPLRGLFYFARLYQKLVGNEKKLYSSKKIELPYPQFVVFYNGTVNEPERQVLELSDSFPKGMNKENAAIQCRAVVLNVNLGYNKRIMERCKMLREYAQYIACVRVYLGDGYSIQDAIDMATDECIRNGILEQILRDNRGEVRSMILTEYDEQAHIEYEKEISYEEGKAEGREEGRDSLSKLIQALLSAGRVDDINKVTKDKDYCNQLMQEFEIE